MHSTRPAVPIVSIGRSYTQPILTTLPPTPRTARPKAKASTGRDVAYRLEIHRIRSTYPGFPGHYHFLPFLIILLADSTLLESPNVPF